MRTIQHLIPGLSDLWAESTGESPICVAVLDGTVDRNHPCFQGADVVEVPTQASESKGFASPHGTHVASVLFGQHGTSVWGVAPRCRGVFLPVYPANAKDGSGCSQQHLAHAILLAVANGANLINISGGELVPSQEEADPFLIQAIQHCLASNVLIIAAAGNNGCRCLHIPAAMPSVLAVGAMNEAGQPLDFSNWGDKYQHQGLLALGENILGAVPGGGVTTKTGTSFATAIVSGVAALLLSIQFRRTGSIDPAKVRTTLLQAAIPCDPTRTADCRRFLTGALHVPTARNKLFSEQIIPATVFVNPYPQGKEHSVSESSESIAILEPEPPSNGILVSEYPETPTSVGMVPKELGISTSEVAASGCGCGGKSAEPTLVYALGQIGYDFGTESNRDSLLQLSSKNLHEPNQLLEYLQQDPSIASILLWTLSVDATVLYVIAPYGPFAAVGYERLREFLEAQIKQGVERVSVPGVTKGSVKLLNGQTVPLLYPEVRGMYSWSTSALVKAVLGEAPTEPTMANTYQEQADGIQNFLERIYYEIRNLGLTPQERAANYAATNAFQLQFIYRDAIKAGLKLDSIAVEISPICRPGAKCYDVKLTFFHPTRRQDVARRVYRFTIDVSEAIPVTVGKPRHWDIY